MPKPDGRVTPVPPTGYQKEVYEMDAATNELKRVDKYIPPLSPNGRDPLAGLPWWVKAVFLIGVPSAIALGLTWQVSTVLTTRVESNGKALEVVHSEARLHDQAVVSRFDYLSRQTDETNRILTATCNNQAKDDAQRDRCAGRR
jgi:hypothetical protein